MSKKILVLFGHPAFQKSRVQRALAESIRNLDGVTFHDLYEAYPDLAIDVKQEQALLEAHDGIVLQHPLYWYSTPAIFKEWCDLVLQFNYAYGPQGDRLEGKFWAHALSCGGAEQVYRRDGANRFTLKEFLAPFDQTAHLCGMNFIDPFVVHSALRLDPETDLKQQAQRYREWIQNLQKGLL
jgi:glutathione-regulated potassium-efflux system ancillary protein KefG